MGTLPQKKPVLPLVRGTIDTHVAAAFVVVTVASRMRTGNIEENTTARTLLVHTSLRGRVWQRLLQGVDKCIHRLPGNGRAQITRRRDHGGTGRLDTGGVEQGTEGFDHHNIAVGPRDPGLAVWIKTPFMQGTVGEWHISFHGSSVSQYCVTASLLESRSVGVLYKIRKQVYTNFILVAKKLKKFEVIMAPL